MTRILFASLLALSLALPAFAEESPKPDDQVIYDLSSEDWVATKTAHVTLDVEASVNAATAGTMRSDMIKAVNDAAKGDWRLTSFGRSQDQTGLERWSVDFDARIPEAELGGLSDAVKKVSKAGMQLTIGNIDFSPTLEETEATRAALRTKIVKEVSDQLTTLNTSLPGRSYRISQITFDSDSETPPPPMPGIRRPAVMSMAAVPAMAPAEPPLERSEKITVNAHVVFAALPPLGQPTH